MRLESRADSLHQPELASMGLLRPQSEFVRLNEGYYPSYRVIRGRL